jgi:hypothetical protein
MYIIHCIIHVIDLIMSKKPLTLLNYSNDISYLNILITFYSIVFQNVIYIIYYTLYRFHYVKEAFDIIKLLKLLNDISFLNILITFYSIVFQNEIYIIYYVLCIMYYVLCIMYYVLCIMYNLLYGFNYFKEAFDII